MVAFYTATVWLKEGKKITRPHWKKGSYWALGYNNILLWTDGTKASIHIEQLEAYDWIIFEEELKYKQFSKSEIEKFQKEIIIKVNKIFNNITKRYFK